MKKVLLLALTLLLLLPSFAATAATSNVTYDGDAGKFFFENDGKTELDSLLDFKSVMPGDTLTQTVNLKNNADDKVKIMVYTRFVSYNMSEADLASELKLTVSVPDESPMFKELPLDSADLTEWTQIGVLYSGADVDLLFSLDVPTTLDNSFANQSLGINWQFSCVEMPVDEPLWVCPNCHKSKYHIDDSGEYAVYVCDNCGYKEDMLCDICHKHMKKVIEYDLNGKKYYFYRCLGEDQHETDPSPETTDTNNTPWIVLAAASGALLLLIIFYKRRKERAEE